MDTSLDFMDKFRRGDERAFSNLFKELYPRLTYYSYTITKNELSAQEIASESLLRIFQRCSKFDSIQKVERFLFVTAKNASLDYLRSEKQFDQVEDYEDEIEENPETSYLINAVNRLPAKSRDVLLLIYFKKLTYRHIAAKMSTTKKNIENLRAYALLKLRQEINLK